MSTSSSGSWANYAKGEYTSARFGKEIRSNENQIHSCEKMVNIILNSKLNEMIKITLDRKE